MINSILNNLQLYRTKYHAGLIEEKSLMDLLLTKPAQVAPMLTLVFGMYDQGSVLDTITGGLGRTITVENREFEWEVFIDSDKAIPIVKATTGGVAIDPTSTTQTPGLAGEPITIWVRERWFGPGAVLEFDDNEYQVRVSGEPYLDGDLFAYTCYVVGDDEGAYIPPELFAPGKALSRVASAYEEGSDEADIINYFTPVKLRNQLEIVRLTYDITGSAVSSVMVLELKDPKTNKSTKYIAQLQEWIAMREWYKRVDRMLMLSKYSTKIMGTNGRPVYIGAGLRQQISPANRRYYTTLTLDILDDFLSDLSFNIRGFGERKFVGLSGEMGLRELDRVLREKASGYTLIDTKFVTGSGQNLTLGGQFTTYKGLNGVEFTLKHFPLYDDTVLNRKLHPITGRPLESYRITILNIGLANGQANIMKVERKDRGFVAWTNGGSVLPGAGHAKGINVMRSNAKDAYTVNFLGEIGIMVQDPTSCGELICDAA